MDYRKKLQQYFKKIDNSKQYFKKIDNSKQLLNDPIEDDEIDIGIYWEFQKPIEFQNKF